MKSKFMTNRAFWAALAWLSLAGGLSLLADDTKSVERVLFKNGAVMVARDSVYEALTNEVTMPHGIKVMTNGTFRVQEGKERRFAEGQVLGADGMLSSPDGTLMPVFDHIALRTGAAVMVKDGEPSPLGNDTDLADGRRVTADGHLVNKAGVRRKLLDGEVFDLAGQAVAVSDTVTLKDGKVVVQKDGSSIEVPSGRSLMMNDGTKVFGDGTVVFKDGTRAAVPAGEILKLEGVGGKGK